MFQYNHAGRYSAGLKKNILYMQRMAAQVRLRPYTLFWPIIPELCLILTWTYYAAYFSGIISSCLLSEYLIRLGCQNQRLTVYTVSTINFNLPIALDNQPAENERKKKENEKVLFLIFIFRGKGRG